MWIIEINKVYFLITTAIIVIQEINGKTIVINKDPTGQAGSDETYIECLINMDGIRIVREVNIYAKFNRTMEVIVTYYDYGDTAFSTAGRYLKDRVTYYNITRRSNRTELRFNILLCEDDTDYQCQLVYVPDLQGPSEKLFSDLSHLTVTVPPSRPRNLTVSKHNKTYLEFKSSQENAFENLTFREGDTITVNCTGEVGKPPANLTMQKILRNGTAYTLTPDNMTNNAIPNCSFVQRSIFTTTLIGEDNGSMLRCAVEGKVDEYIETSQFDVLYPVRIPDVTISPNLPTRPPVTLHCQGRGNPDPDYTWSKLSNEGQNWEQFSSNQSITLYNLTDSGIYLCEVNNTIGQSSYNNSRNITITFKASSNELDEKENSIFPIWGIIVLCLVLVFAGGITFFVAYITVRKKCSRKKSKGRQLPTGQVIGFDNTAFLDNEKEKTRKHGDKYMKEEEEPAENKNQGDPLMDEYAVVGDHREVYSISTMDGDEIIEYAEVNEVNDFYQCASGSDLYDHAHDRQHKESIDVDSYDTTESIRKENLTQSVKAKSEEHILRDSNAKDRSDDDNSKDNLSSELHVDTNTLPENRKMKQEPNSTKVPNETKAVSLSQDIEMKTSEGNLEESSDYDNVDVINGQGIAYPIVLIEAENNKSPVEISEDVMAVAIPNSAAEKETASKSEMPGEEKLPP